LVVTLFMVFMLFVFFAIVALLWCFRGFSREVKRSRKPGGMWVRVTESNLTPMSKIAAKATIEARPTATPYALPRAASVVSLVLLLASR
jgi:hypothetical protein